MRDDKLLNRYTYNTDHAINNSFSIEKSVLVYQTSPRTLKKDMDKILTSNIFTYQPNKATLIKINGNYDIAYPGSNTSRWFLDAVLGSLIDKDFSDIKVIEGDGYLYTAERMIRNTGLIKVLEKYGIEFLSYENSPRDENELPMMLKESQLINLPVTHTHGLAIISCASKNLFGLLPKYRWKYHEILSEKLLELVETVETFTIVDGTVGMKGESTRRGDPVRTDLILAGWNLLNIDMVVAKILGFSPTEIPLLKLAINRHIIDSFPAIAADFTIDDLPIFDFRFSHSTVKKLSLWVEENKYSKQVLEWKPIRDFYHNMRGLYERYYFYKKKRSLFNGPWTEYDKLWSDEQNKV